MHDNYVLVSKATNCASGFNLLTMYEFAQVRNELERRIEIINFFKKK